MASLQTSNCFADDKATMDGSTSYLVGGFGIAAAVVLAMALYHFKKPSHSLEGPRPEQDYSHINRAFDIA